MMWFVRAIVPLGMLGFAGTAADAGDAAAKGRALAERLCATCHLGPGQGEKHAPGEIPGFNAVARRPGQTVEAIMDWLRSIPPMMPNHHLSQDEMEELAKFIMSLRDAPS
jgi:mono/diheme cytochrome c family protein